MFFCSRYLKLACCGSVSVPACAMLILALNSALAVHQRHVARTHTYAYGTPSVCTVRICGQRIRAKTLDSLTDHYSSVHRLSDTRIVQQHCSILASKGMSNNGGMHLMSHIEHARRRRLQPFASSPVFIRAAFELTAHYTRNITGLMSHWTFELRRLSLCAYRGSAASAGLGGHRACRSLWQSTKGARSCNPAICRRYSCLYRLDATQVTDVGHLKERPSACQAVRAAEHPGTGHATPQTRTLEV